ncbi:MAG: phosphatidate cytidylyltransferase [Acidobacteriota bacterium]
MSRILTALVLIPPLVVVIWLAPAWGFVLLAHAVALLAVHEVFGLMEKRGYRPFRKLGYLATAGLVASSHVDTAAEPWTLLLVILVIALAAITRGAPSANSLAEVGVTLFGCLYVGILVGSLVGLRLTPPDTAGRRWVLFLLAVIMVGDTGAFYIGRALGRHRLAPSLSPNKTVEGFLGGLAASLATALAASRALFSDIDMLRAAGLGLTLALLGVGGDLFESLLKRSAGVKDASSLIPGHGGVLDRLDGVLFASPALLFYVRVLC